MQYAGGTLAPRATTRRFALSGSEWVTTAVAALVSSTAYVVAGFPYLARGVAGDLAGFVGLAAAGLVAGAPVRHEALTCLTFIGVVLLLDLQWPPQLNEPTWWALPA